MKPIQAGDLVVVTKPTPCCGNASGLGDIFRVKNLSFGEGYCQLCNDDSSAWVAWANEEEGYKLSMLTRIDPLPESETQDNHESLTA